MDRKIARFFVSSTSSWLLLENKYFADLFSEMYDGRYNLPSRSYLQDNVLHPMYEETKDAVINDLKKHMNIALTTDAWTSMTQQSYITVTAHVINEQCELKSYVLSTSEITKRHTSVNLMEHIHKVLQEYKIGTKHNVVCNFNAINLNDIHEEDRECDDEVNLLSNENDLAEEVRPQPSCSKTQDMINNLAKEGKKDKEQLKHAKQSTDVNQSIPKKVTFITDNASDIGKAIKTIGGYPWFGCAGHHLNLVAQAGFKQVEAAAKLVKKCKRIVEYIRSSGPASYMLIDFQHDLEMPLLKVLQENNTRWWSILLMMERIRDNMHALMLTIAANTKYHLLLAESEQSHILLIIKLLKPFKELGDKLGSEKNVSISLVVPVIHALKDHLEAEEDDTSMIKDMKRNMLEKLENRYSDEQIKILKICTLLDVRHKNDDYVKDNYDELSTQVKELDTQQKQHESQVSQPESQVTQHEIPATEGQEVANLSLIGNTGRRSKKKASIFEYDNDVIPQETDDQQWNDLYIEVTHYQKIRMKKEEKEKTDVLTWWRFHQKLFPNLFKLVKVFLHIPATSVPSERIFSLAGYIVRSRRSKILAANVDKAIFLKKNEEHIPRNTLIL